MDESLAGSTLRGPASSASTGINPLPSCSATACSPAESRGFMALLALLALWRLAGVPGAGPWLKTGLPMDDSCAENPDVRFSPVEEPPPCMDELENPDVRCSPVEEPPPCIDELEFQNESSENRREPWLVPAEYRSY